MSDTPEFPAPADLPAIESGSALDAPVSLPSTPVEQPATHASPVAGEPVADAAPVPTVAANIDAPLPQSPSAALGEPASTDLPLPYEPPTWVYPAATNAQEFPRAAKSGKAVRNGIIAGVLSGLISGFGGYAIATHVNTSPQGSISLPSVPGDTSPRPDNSIAGLAKKVLPTVVSINVSSGTAEGTGSGFIIRTDATESYILTNNHVATGAGADSTITVQFQDQTTEKATVVGTDSSYDLAVLKVMRGNLPVAVLGNSDDVVVGDATIAIGSPLGLTGTVTSGIVSALNRPVTAGESGSSSSFINAIQTDAAINPGNSGGPLINAAGQVIGINSAIATLGQNTTGTQSGSIGLGFSIPINQAKRVAEQLMSTGHATHAVVGVQLDMNYNGTGALVQTVTPGGPASKTVLKAGDVITAIDGVKVSNGTELIVRIRAHVPGDSVTLSRQGASDVTVVLGSQATQ